MLWVTAALAHPVGGVFPSHQLALRVGPEAVEVDYGIRLPTHDVVKELQAVSEDLSQEDADAFSQELLDELRDNLIVELDGEAVAWERLDSSAQGTVKYVYYDQTLRIPVTDDAHSLRLSNGNYPDQLSYFMTEVLVDATLAVEESSMLFFDEGVLKRNLDGRYRMDEEMREITLSWRALSWTELRDGEGLLPLGDALPPEVSATRWLGFGLLGVIGAVLIGLFARRPRSSADRSGA